MKKTYRKPKMKPYNRADNQISALDELREVYRGVHTYRVEEVK